MEKVELGQRLRDFKKYLNEKVRERNGQYVKEIALFLINIEKKEKTNRLEETSFAGYASIQHKTTDYFNINFL